MLLDPRGTIRILEEFFGEPLSELDHPGPQELPEAQLQELLDRVFEWANHVYTDIQTWEKAPLVAGTVSAVMGVSDVTTLSGAPLLSLFFDSVAAPDPSIFMVMSSSKESLPDRRELARWFRMSKWVAPLVDAKALTLYSPFFMTLRTAGALDPPEEEIRQLYGIGRGHKPENPDDDLYLPRLLLPFMHGLTAFRLGADIVALGGREVAPKLEGVIPAGSGALLRLRALERVRLPNLAGVSPDLAARVRADDAALGEVRTQLSRALVELPAATTESEQEAATELFIDGLQASACALLREAKFRPTIPGMIGGALAVGGGLVQSLAAGAVTPGALYSAGTAPLTLATSWLIGRRARQSKGIAGRLMLELSAVPE